jgi:polysaccharide biosynthesis/export protein
MLEWKMRTNRQLAVAWAVLLGMTIWGVAARASERHASSTPGSTAPDQAGKSPDFQTRTSGSPTFQERHPRYRVAAADVINIDFPFSPEFNQTVTVQPDGYVTLREIGEFYVQGKTTPELAEALRAAYGKTLHDPVITVDLKDFQKPYFIAGGQVGKPGRYELREDTTLAEAVSIAGGFLESAKHSQVLLFRRAPNNMVEVKKLDLKKMLNSANLQEDVYLRPGDMFYVPQNQISKIKKFLPYYGISTYFTSLP